MVELFPAIKGHLGSWTYYSTKMKARNLARQVQFATQVNNGSSLDDLLQRALNEGRSKEHIARYLSKHEDRFFNSIVIAALDGEPVFSGVRLADDPGMALIADDFEEDFGVLKFGNGVKYYALDGQHRLKAITALLENETDFAVPQGFADEEFPVIMVVPRRNEGREAFMKKYRRLFGHLNRYAKPMDEQTKIAIDEDDAFAIVTRRLLQEHPFFQKRDKDEFVRYAGGANLGSEDRVFTTLKTLYDMNKSLLMSSAIRDKAEDLMRFRPEDEVLDQMYSQLAMIWDSIVAHVPKMNFPPASMRHRNDVPYVVDGQEQIAHAWFRPLTQVALCTVARQILDHRLPSPDAPTAEDVDRALRGLSELPFNLGEAPFRRLVFVEGDGMDDERTWQMRSEDRKEAAVRLRQVMSFIVGTSGWDSESLGALRLSWAEKLWGGDEAERDWMWSEIIRQAEAYRAKVNA